MLNAQIVMKRMHFNQVGNALSGKKHCACHPQVWESSHKRKERTQPDPNVSLPDTDRCGKCERFCPMGDAVPFCQRLSSAHSAPFFFQPNSVKAVTWNSQGKEHIRLTASSLSRGEVLKMQMERTENVTKAKQNLKRKKCCFRRQCEQNKMHLQGNIRQRTLTSKTTCQNVAVLQMWVTPKKQLPVFKLRFVFGL